MNEVVREFLLETHENLAQLDLDFVTLEKEPTERETLARVFRTLHTVKGTAGFLGLPTLQAVAHAGESLLSRLRAGELLFNAEIATGLLAAVDAVRRMLDAIEATGDEGSRDYTEVIQALDKLRARTSGAPAAGAAAARADAPMTLPISVAPPAPNHPPTIIAPPVTAEPAADGEGPRTPAVADSAVRIDVGLLDNMMTLVGELVLARNQIMQFGAAQADVAFLGTVQRLNLLTSELQTNVMQTRLQPIANVWSKFPRVVRDLALACGKQARLEMQGRDTELDKTIIEAIRDPLTHLVRNAVDHGIEPPPDRLQHGKPAEGCVTLSARHEGGKVLIEIGDDGIGIDPERVRAKAIQQQLITAEQADRLSENELINLVFLPGVSTTDKITQFSGRGVGMDVVRTNVEKIGGTVNIENRLGQGTTVRMKIPLTLAIIPALSVSCGCERYAIPQVNLLELVRLESEQAQRGIEQIHGVPVYRLRGNLLPVVYLDHQLEVEASPCNAGAVHIVVLQADDRQFGLVVDAIHDTEEIVVKPLQQQLKGIGLFAGATIMGDGRVALILDVLGLAQRANVVAEVRQRGVSRATSSSTVVAADCQTVLVCITGDGSRIGIPLSLVARLEEFPSSMLERAGGGYVVQYRDEILPLIDVGQVLGAGNRPAPGDVPLASNGAHARRGDPDASGGSVPVVVYAVPQGHVGLVVGAIVDIVEQSITTRARSQRAGVLYTAVIQGRVTEFIDIDAIIRTVDPQLFAHSNAGESCCR